MRLTKELSTSSLLATTFILLGRSRVCEPRDRPLSPFPTTIEKNALALLLKFKNLKMIL